MTPLGISFERVEPLRLFEWLVVAGSLSCTSLSNLVPFKPEIDWRTSPPHRVAADVEKLGHALTDEEIRALTGEISDQKTQHFVWQSRYDSKEPPPAIPSFSLRLLREAYDPVPRPILRSLVWQDKYPSFASPDFGTVINRARVTDLVWFVDSVTILAGSASEKELLVRPPGDFALLMLLSHELAHLAISFAPLGGSHSESIAECAADVIGGFQSAVISTRMGTNGTAEFQFNGAVSALGAAVIPGEWISRNLHPDREQRAACLERGVSMFAEQAVREPLAGSLLLTSPRDSLVEKLSLGRISLVTAATEEAKSILSLPGDEGATKPDGVAMEDTAAATLLRLTDSLLIRVSQGTVGAVIGVKIAPGVSLFPGAQLEELLVRMPAPWKCAVVVGNADIGGSIACYALTGGLNAMMIRQRFSTTIQRDSSRLGFRVSSIGLATTRTAELRLRQWLFEKGADRVIVSVYDEPYAPNANSNQETGTRVFWFSFSQIHISPSGRQH